MTKHLDPPTLQVTHPDGRVDIMYCAQDYQRAYHESSLPNLIMIGPRGTGKSLTIRMDSHMKALAVPKFRYLTLRRTMPELRKSHLSFIGDEMNRLGGYFHSTNSEAHYPNGSTGWFGHCQTDADVMKHLGGQYDLVNFDESTTYPWDMFQKLAATARVPEGVGRIAMVRGGTNPLGVSASDIKKYFIDKNVRAEDDPDYLPDEYGVIPTKLSDNRYLDAVQYRRRLASLPAHVRRAWLDGEWVSEGTYFADFRATIDGSPWHTINQLPTVSGAALLDQPWISIYRCLDWGYSPDPCVCLWVAVLPDGRALVIKERQWEQTLVADVARAIVRESEGMRVRETFADPSMFMNHGEAVFSVGEAFERGGVPLTKSINDRTEAGYAIHDYLNTVVDGLPKLQLLAAEGRMGCPNLIRTITEVTVDPKDPKKIANGNDHWVIALAYFCMGMAPPSRDPKVHGIKRWMLPKKKLSLALYR